MNKALNCEPEVVEPPMLHGTLALAAHEEFEFAVVPLCKEKIIIKKRFRHQTRFIG
jgi:hypothetical protein